ncbi:MULTISPECIES: SH3 domain-containing protein [Fischerella]|uniref:SH3 domain-containing protein n=1 Tax=Fischerella TaxID=1190 RepID=UPI000377E0F0|nr:MULTISPECIES: SH3 domain-containing protein [Fischerella]MBD2432663.1 SH3 domain-containing protein [Fischerella sp. FACHB-380]
MTPAILLVSKNRRTSVNNQAAKLAIVLSFSCISVLVNTGIANHHVLAQSPQQQKCDIFAYVVSKDPQGLNVRSGASPTHKILGQIAANETVKITAASGKWVQVTDVTGDFKGTGWVYLPMLGISSRGYGTNGVNLYTNADQQSQKVGRIPPSTSVKLLGCQGEWAQVEYQGIKGWLASEDQCGAALTSCS